MVKNKHKYFCLILAIVLVIGAEGLHLLRRYYRTEKTALPYSQQITQKQMTFFAHRGYSDHAPEESIEAEEMAAKKGFQGLNIDLWPTKKDSKGNFDFAVSHSDDLSVISDRTGLLTDLTAKQVRKVEITHGNGRRWHKKQYVSLLGDMIRIANKYNLPMQLEMKGHYTAEQKDVLFKRIHAFKNKVYIECIYRGQLAYMAQKIRAENATNRFTTTYICFGKPTDVRYSHNHHIDRISVEYANLTQKKFDNARKNGLEVSSFAPVGTKDTKEIAYHLYKMGLRSFTSASRAWKSDYLSYLLLFKKYR